MLLSSCQNQEPELTPTIGKTPSEIAQTKQPESTATPEGISIAKIQAAAHISPYRGQDVSGLPGIVTVVDFDGFYMQSLVPDQNPDTSEGLFVFTEFIPSVRPGDEVRVDGMVEEMITNWLGNKAGVKAVLFGCLAGGLIPGSPYAAFPIAAGFYKAGAGLGAMVGFITAWSLWSVTRLPVEIALIDPKVALIRYGITFIVPPAAGLLAFFLEKSII